MSGFGSGMGTGVSIDNVLLTALAIMVLVIFCGAIYTFVRAIFLFIFSNGDADKIKNAWDSIRHMVIGIMMSIFFLVIFPLVFERLHIQGYKTFTAQNILGRATDILSTIFEGKPFDGLGVGPSTALRYGEL